MINNNNYGLEKYEIKKPDYDYIDRKDIKKLTSSFLPKRYKRNGDYWYSLKNDEYSPKEKSATLLFLGDITCFEKQFEEARTENGYNFEYEFEKVRTIFESADFVAGNLETMIFPDAPYRTEKYVSEQNYHCNAPIEFLEAIRTAGVDMLTTANNHDLDTGAVGLGETIDYLDYYGFIHTGTFKQPNKRYELVEINGIKVAITAFATEHNNKRENLTREGATLLLNTYNKSLAKNIIEDARTSGAEIVITCIHWGTENTAVINSQQERIARELASMGYDCIIGSHPHVLQPFSMVEVENKRVPIFYSLGNFISHNANNFKAQSCIACIELKRVRDGVQIECSYIPVFTSDNYGEKKYVVLPIHEDSLDIKNKKRLKRIKNVVGNQIGTNLNIEFPCYSEKIISTLPTPKVPKLEIKGITIFPITFDNGTYVFTVYKDHALISGISSRCKSPAFQTPLAIGDIPVVGIMPGAFEGNHNIKKINFRRSISSISERAFKDCGLLEGFQLSNGTTEIRKEAFANCTSLVTVVIKTSINKIENRAFANCINLRSVKVPPTLSNIADDAFEGCTNMIFYCEEGSFAEKYALEHGFKVIHMTLMEGNMGLKDVLKKVSTKSKQEIPKNITSNNEANRQVFVTRSNGQNEKHPETILETCNILGVPLPEHAVCGNQPSTYIKKGVFDGTLNSIVEILGDRLPQIEREELELAYIKFKKKYATQNCLNYNMRDLTVYFCDWLLFAKNQGFSHSCYFDYELYNKEPISRDTFLNEEYRTHVNDVCNKRKARKILIDKARFNTTFAKYVKRDWVDTTTCTLKEFEGFVTKHESFFGKPVRGTGGAGARIIDRNSDSLENLFKLCKEDNLIVEEIIKQHEEIAEFNASTLNTVRINTLLCADNVPRIMVAAARFGRSGNVVDNFHGGGVVAIVDVESGKIITEALNQAHIKRPDHPDSEKQILGFQYPEWEKIKAAVCDAALMIPEMRHIGWDVALTKDGEVEFVEGNGRPNFDVLQSPDQIGKMFRYETYIRDLEVMNGIKTKVLPSLRTKEAEEKRVTEPIASNHIDLLGLNQIFEMIDQIEDIEQLKSIEKELRDPALMKQYWKQRELAITSENNVAKKRARIKCKLIQKKYGASIPVSNSVKRFTAPHGLTGIHISAYAKLGTGCTLFQHVVIGSNTMLDSNSHGFPIVGDNVYIGAGAMIIGNVKIGNNVRIGANCIVTQDVADNSVCILTGAQTVVKNYVMNNKFLPAEKYREMMREEQD